MNITINLTDRASKLAKQLDFKITVVLEKC